MQQAGSGLILTIKRTGYREFLDEINPVVPWPVLVKLVAAHAPKTTKGRPSFPMATMLRFGSSQQWIMQGKPAIEVEVPDVGLFLGVAGVGKMDNPVSRQVHDPEASSPAGKAQAGRAEPDGCQRSAESKPAMHQTDTILDTNPIAEYCSTQYGRGGRATPGCTRARRETSGTTV